MADETSTGQGAARNDYVREWRGAAWTAVAAMFAASMCRALAQSDPLLGNYSTIYHIDVQDYFSTLFVLTCVLFYHGRFRRIFLSILLIFSAFSVVALISGGPWGDGTLHVSEERAQRYFAYTFLSDGLFAFASSVLLLASVALTWADWIRKRRL